jgi:hypothetical protein
MKLAHFKRPNRVDASLPLPEDANISSCLELRMIDEVPNFSDSENISASYQYWPI